MKLRQYQCLYMSYSRPNYIFLLWLAISCFVVRVANGSGNWCSRLVTKPQSCKVWQNWPGNGAQLVTTYRMVTQQVWECCPGFSPPSCTAECFNCSTVLRLQTQVEQLQQQVSTIVAGSGSSAGWTPDPGLGVEALDPGISTGDKDRGDQGPLHPQRTSQHDSAGNLARERGHIKSSLIKSDCPQGCMGPPGPPGPSGPRGLPGSQGFLGSAGTPMHPVGSSYPDSHRHQDLIKRLESLERKVSSLTTDLAQSKTNLEKFKLLTARVRILEGLLPLSTETDPELNCSVTCRPPAITEPPPYPPQLQADMPEIHNDLAFIVSRVVRGKFAPDRKMHKAHPQTPFSDKLDETKLGKQFEADVAYPAARRRTDNDAVPYVEMSVASGALLRHIDAMSVLLTVVVISTISF